MTLALVDVRRGFRRRRSLFKAASFVGRRPVNLCRPASSQLFPLPPSSVHPVPRSCWRSCTADHQRVVYTFIYSSFIHARRRPGPEDPRSTKQCLFIPLAAAAAGRRFVPLVLRCCTASSTRSPALGLPPMTAPNIPLF